MQPLMNEWMNVQPLMNEWMNVQPLMNEWMNVQPLMNEWMNLQSVMVHSSLTRLPQRRLYFFLSHNHPHKY